MNGREKHVMQIRTETKTSWGVDVCFIIFIIFFFFGGGGGGGLSLCGTLAQCCYETYRFTAYEIPGMVPTVESCG